MTVYLTQGMAFAPDKKRLIEEQKKNKRFIYFQSKREFRRKATRQIISTFFTATLIILNISLIAVAFLWFQLVFSVVTPFELAEMVVNQSIQTSGGKTQEFTTEVVNIPPPPILVIDSYGGLGVDNQQKTTQ